MDEQIENGKRVVKNINNGVVIDHIDAGKAMKCLKIMNPNTRNVILIGMNLNSKKQGLKDFIKIEDFYPDEEMVNKIAMIASEATISVIKDSKVKEKKSVEHPKEFAGDIDCINSKCATRNEKYLTPKYIVESIKPLELRCKYCDKVQTEDDFFKK